MANKRGYLGFSKSFNAIDAEERGLVTSGQLAKRLAKSIPGVNAKDISNTLRYVENHHTSSKFNLTSYYNVKITDEEMNALQRCVANRDTSKTPYRATVFLRTFDCGGKFGRKRAVESTFKATVTPLGGRKVSIKPDAKGECSFVKLLGGNHITVTRCTETHDLEVGPRRDE